MEQSGVALPAMLAGREQRRLKCAAFLGEAHGTCKTGSSVPLRQACRPCYRQARTSGPSLEQIFQSIATTSVSSSIATAGPSGVRLACIPLLPLPWEVHESTEGNQSQSRQRPSYTAKAQALMHTVSGICWIEGAFAVMKLLRNDTPSAMIGGALATLGLQAAAPGGQRTLPMFIVLSFCNGSMQVLLNAELAAGLHMSWHSFFSLKFATLSAPVLIFAGMYAAWLLHLEMRRSTLSILAEATNQLAATATPGEDTAPTARAADAEQAERANESDRVAAARALALGFQPFAGERFRLDGQRA